MAKLSSEKIAASHLKLWVAHHTSMDGPNANLQVIKIATNKAIPVLPIGIDAASTQRNLFNK